MVTRIANPKPLSEYRWNFSDLVEELKFPDHYSFGTKDIDLFELAIGISFYNFKYMIDCGFINKKILDRSIQAFYLADRELK